MIIENSFEVPIGRARALDLLTDVPTVARCIPGVTLNETLGDGAHKGTAAVRLGPVALSFAGSARIVETDRDAGTARVEAEGADQKGRGQARANVTFSLVPAGEGTRVDVVTDLTLSGQIAQYGRASGLIKEVANQIIADFVRNLEAKLAAGEAGEEGAPGRPPAGGDRISGLALLFRALRAMLVRLFSGNGRP